MDLGTRWALGSAEHTVIARDHTAWPWMYYDKNMPMSLELNYTSAAEKKTAAARILARARSNTGQSTLHDIETPEDDTTSEIYSAPWLEAHIAPVGPRDKLFYGRRAVVMNGDSIFGQNSDSAYFQLKKDYLERGTPYPFDDLILSGWHLTAIKEKNQIHGDTLYTRDFLMLLRQGNTCALESSRQPDHYADAGRRLKVALHVRRGDVKKSKKERYNDDGYFLSITKKIRTHFPNADVHMFSSTGCKWHRVLNPTTGAIGRRCEQLYDEESFSAFKNRGIKVHLDGDLLVDWAHFVRADVLVLSKSAFSNVPALLNRRCVVWQRSTWTMMKLGHWVRADGMSNENLERCFRGPPMTETLKFHSPYEMRSASPLMMEMTSHQKNLDRLENGSDVAKASLDFRPEWDSRISTRAPLFPRKRGRKKKKRGKVVSGGHRDRRKAVSL